MKPVSVFALMAAFGLSAAGFAAEPAHTSSPAQETANDRSATGVAGPPEAAQNSKADEKDKAGMRAPHRKADTRHATPPIKPPLQDPN